MRTRDEILLNFLRNLKTASDELKEAEYLAEYDPIKYTKKGFHTKIEFKDITDKMIEKLVGFQGNPSFYFYHGFDKIPEFKLYNIRAAQNLAQKDPMAAAFAYQLHKKPKYKELAVPILINLLNQFDIKEKDYAGLSLIIDEPNLLNKIADIVSVIAKNNNNFLRTSGLFKDQELMRLVNDVNKDKKTKKDKNVSYL